jgi:hypothetical protein
MWYVEYLLLNRDNIKGKNDINCDEYNDLLLVEVKLDSLVKYNELSGQEVEAIYYMLGYGDLTNKSKRNKMTILAVFSGVCTKIADALGGVFTNIGYLNYMKDKYNLNDEQIKTLEKYMLSNLRHLVLTKPI